MIMQSIRDDEAVNYIDEQGDLVKLWKRLKEKYARVSTAAADAAQDAILMFSHRIDETANQTLSRYGALKRECKYQGVTITPEQERKILLGRVNP